jgi:hypothetical protein
MIQEQLHCVEVRAALQQTASGLAPQVVRVEVHLRQLLAAAGQEPTVRGPMRAVTDRAEPKRRACLLLILEALADFVAEHVRIRSNSLPSGSYHRSSSIARSSCDNGMYRVRRPFVVRFDKCSSLRSHRNYLN